MTAVSKNLKNKIYIMTRAYDSSAVVVLNDVVDKYNNTYHKTIKVKPKDVKPGFYA